ncbi:MAG: KH domain-containing protein [Clostridia bacterium]|nr:KH domain-containing protein [Clostridia bacterium]
MKEILKTIVESLVENKDAVQINETEAEKSVTYEVKVADSDMGRVIGRQGKLAKSIRTVMKAAGGKEHKKVTVEFID